MTALAHGCRTAAWAISSSWRPIYGRNWAEGAREALMALMITRLAAEPMRETEAQDSATTLNTMGAVVASVTGLSVGHIIRKSMHEDDSLPSRRDVLCSFALAPVGMRAFEDLARFRPRDATHSNLARENDERTFVASWHLHPSEADFTQLGDAVVSWCAQKAPDHTEELESMFKQMRQSMQEEALRLAANDTLPEEVSARQAPQAHARRVFQPARQAPWRDGRLATNRGAPGKDSCARNAPRHRPGLKKLCCSPPRAGA